MKLKNLIYAFVFLIIAAGCNETVIETEQAILKQPEITDLKAGVIATTYYVAKTGNDNNSGTSTSPFLTIQKAANVVNPGDVVIVRDGTYSNAAANYGNEQAVVIINRSGTSSSWITFKSENKWGAVLDGLNFATEHGIMMNADYVRVEGFEIKNILLWAVSAWPGSDNTVFKNNYIHEIGIACSTNINGFSAFQLFGNSNMVIEGNKVRNIGRLAPDEGCSGSGSYYQWHDHGIYIGNSNNITVKNNLFLDCDNGWSIHLYSSANDYSSNISILNNTFYARTQRSVGHIILSCPITTVNIVNNLFIMSATADDIGFNAGENVAIHIAGDYAPYITAATIKNNMMYRGNGIIARSYGHINMSNNIVNTNPLVVDYTKHDFRLQSTSPAINAGVAVGLTTDFSGNAIVGLPDIGANEYGSSAVAPPVVTEQVVVPPVTAIYYNVPITGSGTKNDCGPGYTGSLVTVTMPAKYISSTISQADADSKANAYFRDNIQAYANSHGTCTAVAVTIYYSAPISGSATKNDCGTGYKGSLVSVTMPAKYLSSTISQYDADSKARTYFKNNIQAYANSNGTCTPL